MFNLTQQERRVILFLISIALTGLGINFAAKVNPRIKSAVTVASDIAKIGLNQALEEDLAGMPGVSPHLAKKIIEYRLRHGQFRDIEELKEIKGIGEARYEKLKDLFVVK